MTRLVRYKMKNRKITNSNEEDKLPDATKTLCKWPRYFYLYLLFVGGGTWLTSKASCAQYHVLSAFATQHFCQ